MPSSIFGQGEKFMFSCTKSNISVSDVEKIIKKHFPEEDVTDISEMEDGMFNRVYCISGTGELSNGVVLKLGTTPDIKVLSGEKDIMKTEIAAYQMLRETDIPLPKLYALNTDRSIVPCDYIIMQKLSGITWKTVQFDLPEKETKRLLYELGKITAKINAIRGTHFGYINRKEECWFSTWADAYICLVNESLADAREFGFELPYEEIEQVIEENRLLLDEITIPYLTDNDVFGNIFLTPDTYEMVGVVDFERCLFGDPYMDFASCVTLFDNLDDAKDYIAGYEEMIGDKLHITANDRKRLDLYFLQKAVTTYVEGYRYDDAFRPRVQGYMGMRIRVLLDKIEKNQYADEE